mgnify:CR=1 FL=1
MIPIRDSVRTRHTPTVVIAIIIANAVLFFRELGMSPEQLHQFIRAWGVVPSELSALLRGGNPADAITPISSMFLHGSWLHIISNMWILWLFGDNVEDRFGHGGFLTFYVLTGLTAMIVHVVLHPASTVPTIGASGAIAGVMGAYFLLFPTARILVLVPIFFIPFFLEVPAAFFFLLWVVIQFSSGMSALAQGSSGYGGVAFWAHVGGFAAGMLLTGFFASVSKRR